MCAHLLSSVGWCSKGSDGSSHRCGEWAALAGNHLNESSADRNGAAQVEKFLKCIYKVISWNLTTIPTLHLVFCVHSNSSDAAALTQMFLKGVRILCQLYASPLNSAPSPTPTPAAPDSSRLRSSTQRQSSFSLSPPFNSTQLQTKSTSFSFSAACSKADVDPLQTLEPIWLALGSWFDLLAEEVRRTAEEEAAGSECTSLQHESSLSGRV